MLVPHEISWVFRHLVLESQSNNAVLTSVGYISDGLQVMVLPKVRSSRARLFPSVRLISKSLSVIGGRQLSVLVPYRRADVRNRWPVTSRVEFYTCHYNAYFSTHCPLQWDVRLRYLVRKYQYFGRRILPSSLVKPTFHHRPWRWKQHILLRRYLSINYPTTNPTRGWCL